MCGIGFHPGQYTPTLTVAPNAASTMKTTEKPEDDAHDGDMHMHERCRMGASCKCAGSSAMSDFGPGGVFAGYTGLSRATLTHITLDCLSYSSIGWFADVAQVEDRLAPSNYGIVIGRWFCYRYFMRPRTLTFMVLASLWLAGSSGHSIQVKH